MKSCLILDYGVGNIGSIQSFFKEHSYQVAYGNSNKQILNADLLILPGVGSFKEASQNLHALALSKPVTQRHFENKPTLGICLGLQLMTSASAESSDSAGLNILNGRTERLSDYSRIGWDTIQVPVDNPLADEYFYFNHSYAVHGIRGNRFNANSTRGNYMALTVEDNSIGVQFHPEKSQEAGSKFLAWAEESIWALND
jgi:glutamine amidotransferase